MNSLLFIKLPLKTSLNKIDILASFFAYSFCYFINNTPLVLATPNVGASCARQPPKKIM